jgi:hypothetical protein
MFVIINTTIHKQTNEKFPYIIYENPDDRHRVIVIKTITLNMFF